MKNNEKLSLLIWIRRSKPGKDGACSIIARLTINDTEDEIFLGVKVVPEDWDLETKRTTINNAEGKRINKALTYFEDEKILTHLQFQYSLVTATMIKNVYLGFPPHYIGVKTKKAKLQHSNQYTTLLGGYSAELDQVNMGISNSGNKPHNRLLYFRTLGSFASLSSDRNN